MTAATFKGIYPAFQQIPDATIDAQIASYEALTSDSWSSDQRDTVLALQVADALARSPEGRNARMVAKDGSTPYRTELRRLAKIHAVGQSRIL